MSRITKTEAEFIAKQLVVPIDEKIKKIEDEMVLVIYNHFISVTPKEVIEMKSKHPQYFNKLSGWVYIGYTSIIRVNFEDLVGDNTSEIKLNGILPVSAALMSLLRKQEALKKEETKLFHEITQTIISLGTYKRVSEQFPEAMVHLPKKEKTDLVINTDSVRNKLKQINND